MEGKEMARQPGGVIGFWKLLRRGPWGENVAHRIKDTLQNLAVQLGSLDGLLALIVYGSYARGEAGHQSDLDLLILFAETGPLQRHEKQVLGLISQAESEGRLPVHISPLLASLDELDRLGNDLVHAVASEGIILYGQLSALTRFLPRQLTPAAIITFSLPDATPAVRMRLNRRLHGYAAWRTRNGQRQRVTYPGLITPPARSLGPGVLLVPGERRAAVLKALNETGATHTETDVWLTP
jgi:predicted nucleotidyltransferase